MEGGILEVDRPSGGVQEGAHWPGVGQSLPYLRLPSSFSRLSLRTRAAARGFLKSGVDAEVKKIISLFRTLTGLQTLNALFAFISLIFGIRANELCSRGYQPTAEDIADGYPDPFTEEPLNSECKDVYLVKTGCTVFTVFLLICMIWQFRYRLVVSKLKHSAQSLHAQGEMVRFNHGAEDREARVTKLKLLFDSCRMHWRLLLSFVLEFIACMIHPVSGITRDYRNEMMGRVVYYRFEAVSVSIMFVRLFHLLRLLSYSLQYSTYRRYLTETCENKGMIFLLLHDPCIHPGLFMFKENSAQNPELYLSSFLFVAIFCGGYLIRIAESPASLAHSSYAWNNFWLALLAMTTSFYGDLAPITHYGRLVCAVLMMIWPVLLLYCIQFPLGFLGKTEQEQRVKKKIDAEMMKTALRTAAARVLQFRYRQVKICKACLNLVSRGKVVTSAGRRILTQRQLNEHQTALILDLKKASSMMIDQHWMLPLTNTRNKPKEKGHEKKSSTKNLRETIIAGENQSPSSRCTTCKDCLAIFHELKFTVQDIKDENRESVSEIRGQIMELRNFMMETRDKDTGLQVSGGNMPENEQWLERKASSSSYKSTLEKFEALIPSFEQIDKPSKRRDAEPVAMKREGSGITLTGYEISEEECIAIFNQLDSHKHGRLTKDQVEQGLFVIPELKKRLGDITCMFTDKNGDGYLFLLLFKHLTHLSGSLSVTSWLSAACQSCRTRRRRNERLQELQIPPPLPSVIPPHAIAPASELPQVSPSGGWTTRRRREDN
eukprot:763588-Hanusia_phi.AAC.5